MPLPIEDYALIGDCHTAPLVGRDGSIDWQCFPRFDSGACFAALLGEPEHGRWLIAPVAEVRNTRRKYHPGTLILETYFETDEGTVRIIDFMSLSEQRWDVLHIVEGLNGRVAMRMELIIRFDYGSIMPWVQRSGDTLLATAGPDRLELALSNGLGLLAEEYDTRGRCMLGIFPQALTHTALINTAYLLSIPEEQAKSACEKVERPTAVTQTS